MKERDIKTYLVKRVKQNGGEARKVEWTGRRHAPDWYVMLPWGCYWIELKRPGKRETPAQLREHERLKKYGQKVLVFDSPSDIDYWLLR